MSIDWITVAAQILNFLVLLWLLKRFLYRPILDGIDAREREISDRLAQAAQARTVAEQANEQYRESAARLQDDRESVLAQARDAAEAEHRAALVDAQAQLAREHEVRKAARVDEARQFAVELQRNGAVALLALLRKALKDLADETFEQRMLAHTATRLIASADELRRAAGTERVGTLTTRNPVSDEAREQLDATFASALPDITLHYRTDPERSPGIALQLGGARLEWNVDRYVDALQEQLEQLPVLPAMQPAQVRSDAG